MTGQKLAEVNMLSPNEFHEFVKGAVIALVGLGVLIGAVISVLVYTLLL